MLIILKLFNYDAYSSIKDTPNPLVGNHIRQEIVAENGSSHTGLDQPHLASQKHQGLVILFNGDASVDIRTGNAKPIS